MYIVWQPDFFLLTTYHEHFPTLITMIVSSLYAIVLNSVFHCVVVPEFTLLLFLQRCSKHSRTYKGGSPVCQSLLLALPLEIFTPTAAAWVAVLEMAKLIHCLFWGASETCRICFFVVFFYNFFFL